MIEARQITLQYIDFLGYNKENYLSFDINDSMTKNAIDANKPFIIFSL